MIDTLIDRAEGILRTLVGFDTVSRHGNLDLIGWVEAYLAEHGVAAHRLPDATATKANLYATVGPDAPGGVILSGHSDVVPVDGQDWSTDPFELSSRDGRYFGRGTCDMKGFLALALAAVPLFREGARPVHLAISYDEEVGCLGAPALIDRLRATLPDPRCAIVGEPTMMRPVTAHKGIAVHEVVVRGHEAHSSLTHLGLSANMVAIELMHDLAKLSRDLWDRRDPASPFEPPHATLTVGQMQGGTAANILAREARFTFDLRCPPGDDAGAILHDFRAKVATLDRELSAAFPQAGVTIEQLADAPPLSNEGGAAAEALVRALTGDNRPAGAVPYAAEAGQFARARFATVICGPGSIEQAHQPDEYLGHDQFAAGADFMVGLARYLGEAT